MPVNCIRSSIFPALVWAFMSVLVLDCAKPPSGFGKVSPAPKDNSGTTSEEEGETATPVPLPSAPVLNDIAVSSSNASTVVLQQPTFNQAGYPAPTVVAYIGLDGTIGFSGSSVTNASEGPVNVASTGYTFSGLTASTTYRVIVLAENSSGKFVKQATQATTP